MTTSHTKLADCRECPLCTGCEAHQGCLTDLNHIEWYLLFASPGETRCPERHASNGETVTCARPAEHGGDWHMGRPGVDVWWPVADCDPKVIRP